MADAEGVIQFACELKPSSPLDEVLTAPLLAWRTILQHLGLIGQSPGRYGGLGYGNISRRIAKDSDAFIITASQTSGVIKAGQRELTRINSWSLAPFQAEAAGALPPSSEASTHAMLYAADAGIHWVMHGHCPAIWSNAQALGLPTIAVDVGYGSPQMADAVAALMRTNPTRPLTFVTLGHRDGVFSCGAHAEGAGGALINELAHGLALAHCPGNNCD